MRASRSAPTPTAAPQSRRPSRSLAALGCFWIFSMSLMVMRPRSSKASFTTGSFSIRWRCRRSLASSMVTPSRAVTRSLVMTCSTVCSRFRSKRRSRLVRIPTSRPRRVTGMPLIPFSRMSATAAESFTSGSTVMGSETTADSYFFTRFTSAACRSTDMFLWMNPIPPSAAMAMAMRDSVTVSMAADTMGTWRTMFRVSRLAVSTCFGRTLLSAGTSSTSSNVRASRRSSRLSMPRYSGWAAPRSRRLILQAFPGPMGHAREWRGNFRGTRTLPRAARPPKIHRWATTRTPPRPLPSSHPATLPSTSASPTARSLRREDPGSPSGSTWGPPTPARRWSRTAAPG